MSYDALRRGRVSSAGQAYFITTVTHDRTPLFHDLIIARTVINQMRRLHDHGLLDSLSWVLMPDHLHWLFQLTDKQTLSQVMSRFKANSAREVNRLRQINEPLWQRGFYDHALRADEDLRKTARYIAANPLRAGLVESLEMYSHWDAVWLL